MIRIDENLQKKFIEVYGENTQLLICMEEPAELIKAISKLQRLRLKNPININDFINAINNLHEEIADVYICLTKLQNLFDVSDGEIQKWIDYKEEREIKRFENMQHM